ncbi:hypothetical protein F5H01DRAFT_310427 [Linnemannia elongata]|nr:hypothetical protein F5H01DRAFT_310427 [Linnemannia elongata]
MIHSPVETPPAIPPRPVSCSPAARPVQLSNNRSSLQLAYPQPHQQQQPRYYSPEQQQQQELQYQLQQLTIDPQYNHHQQTPKAFAQESNISPSTSDRLETKEHPYKQASRHSLVAQPTYLLSSSSVTSIPGTLPPNRAQYHHRLSAPLPLSPSSPQQQQQLPQNQHQNQQLQQQSQLRQKQHSFHGTPFIPKDTQRDLSVRPRIIKASSLPTLVPPPIPTATRPPFMTVYPSESTLLVKPGNVVGAPALVRMSLLNGHRLIAAGPPKIIKNPQKIKALLERPVPRIAVQKRLNTLLGDFYGENVDVNRNGKVIDTSASTRQKHSPPHKDKAKKKSRKISGIVVGIDFGNTFTGVSYAYQNGGEMIDVVKWPKSTSAYSKVPTVNLYNSETDVRRLTEWGSSAVASYRRSKGNRTLISDYKLQFFDEGRRSVMKHGLFLTDVLTHYLRGVHEYLMEEINKAQALSSGTVPMHYCVTVPKSWSRSTQGLILRCYVDAGIISQTRAPNVVVISEAEAAATYCREHCVEADLLEDGDLFMICDAGGRTTQVTVFRVDDSLGVRHFEYLSSSHAEDCGSVMLDQNFKGLVLQRLSGLDLDARPQRQKALETLLDGFAEIKSLFDTRAKEEIKHLSVPMGLDIYELNPIPDWMDDDFMAVSGQELCDKVFDPVIERIVGLILEQAQEHPRIFAGLFLVGGFGSNKYLCHKLKETFLLATHAGLIEKVVMVPKAELAVARGAVIYGLKSAAAAAKRSRSGR